MNTYEKKHKEEVVRATQLWECGDITRENLEYIFPELAESEDERISREISEFISNFYNGNYEKPYDYTLGTWVGWLDKQAGKDKLIQELGKYKVKYTQEVLEKHINSMSNKDDERLRKTTISFLKDFAEQGYENAVECIDWLEKQGEKQQGKSALEAIKEEKVDNANYVSVNKSFNIGDWVVTNEYGGRYKAKIYAFIGNGMVEFEDGTFETEENLLNDYHLWSLQDAKDGDVLVHNSITFIFKGIEDGIVKGLCSELSDYILNFGEPEYDKDYYPATKEQRVALFAKMKEAGYEWDSKNKNLKLLITNGGDFESENCIQKTTKWNKEDEIRLNRICKTLWKNRKGDTDEIYQQEQDIDWLKTLKQRMEK